ncbi:MAG TPA: CDP-alcohol phosphatidyltransferase, partial [Chromatiaceae bacterium]|nr:CDP-alcohol phosphatidyltransferase [Chromatiaceae bacterium]
MKCLILAAGSGSRLRRRADNKPLFPFLGMPLLERTIRSAHIAGADDFVVVTGHDAGPLQAFLERLARQLDLPITTVHNPRWQQAGNGASVLVAESRLDSPFLLLMADHLFDPELARRLIDAGVPEDGLRLAVDGDRHNPLVDLDDVTRVKRMGERILEIGKGLEQYDGFDTGLFLATPGLFEALREAEAAGDTSLSGGVRRLAARGKALALEVGGGFWCDLDDEAALERAEKALLSRARGKDRDGPVSRWLNRAVSIRLSRWLVRLPVTPNQISLFSFALSLAAAGLFMVGGYPALAAGGVLAQVASIIDGCDGEIARLKHLGSDYGGWLDAVLDRYADAFLLFGLTWHLLHAQAGDAALLA